MEKQNWYFSFGVGTKLKKHYAKFYGTLAEAQRKMVDYYGQNWCCAYPEDKIKELAEKYGWTEIQDNEKTAMQYKVYNDTLAYMKESVSKQYAEKFAENNYVKLADYLTEQSKKYGRNCEREFSPFELKDAIGKVICSEL